MLWDIAFNLGVSGSLCLSGLSGPRRFGICVLGVGFRVRVQIYPRRHGLSIKGQARVLGSSWVVKT